MKTFGSSANVFAALLLFAMMSGVSYGQEKSACNADYERYCTGLKPGAGQVLHCLLRNFDRLNPGCRSLLNRLTASRGKAPSFDLKISSSDQKPFPVPEEYRKMYTYLETALTGFESPLKSTGKKNTHKVIFGAQLVPANGNRGRDLLKPEAIEDVQRYLDGLKDLGIQGVTVSVGYPLYTPGFPGYKEYASFYRQVAREVRKRDMKLCVESHVVFANTSLSDLRTSYTSLTFNTYKAAKREMVSAILRDMEPDYLDVGSEPDTEATLTGLRELSDPLRYTEYLRQVTEGLDKGRTKIMAGIGTWGNLAFATNIAKSTSIDALAIHVYPATERALGNAFAIAAIARENGKGIVVDEAWLLKSDRYLGGSSPGWAEMFRRDNFSFWIPLDQKFLAVMTRFSRAEGVEYLSFSGTGYFFAYLDYNEKSANRLYRDMSTLQNREVLANIKEGRRTPTGEYYKALIEGNAE
jgi:hypothetical protein